MRGMLLLQLLQLMQLLLLMVSTMMGSVLRSTVMMKIVVGVTVCMRRLRFKVERGLMRRCAFKFAFPLSSRAAFEHKLRLWRHGRPALKCNDGS